MEILLTSEANLATIFTDSVEAIKAAQAARDAINDDSYVITLDDARFMVVTEDEFSRYYVQKVVYTAAKK